MNDTIKYAYSIFIKNNGIKYSMRSLNFQGIPKISILLNKNIKVVVDFNTLKKFRVVDED